MYFFRVFRCMIFVLLHTIVIIIHSCGRHSFFLSFFSFLFLFFFFSFSYFSSFSFCLSTLNGVCKALMYGISHPSIFDCHNSTDIIAFMPKLRFFFFYFLSFLLSFSSFSFFFYLLFLWILMIPKQ